MKSCFSSPLPLRASADVVRTSPSLSGFMCLVMKSSTILIATGALRERDTLWSFRRGIVYNLSCVSSSSATHITCVVYHVARNGVSDGS